MTLTFNPLQAMVMTYSQVKAQGQWSVGSEDRVETNGRKYGQTEATALPPTLTRSVTMNFVTKYTLVKTYITAYITTTNKNIQLSNATTIQLSELQFYISLDKNRQFQTHSSKPFT